MDHGLLLTNFFYGGTAISSRDMIKNVMVWSEFWQLFISYVNIQAVCF